MANHTIESVTVVATYNQVYIPIKVIFYSYSLYIVIDGHIGFGDLPCDHCRAYIKISLDEYLGNKDTVLITPDVSNLQLDDTRIDKDLDCRFRELINNQILPDKVYHLQQTYQYHLTEGQSALYDRIDNI